MAVLSDIEVFKMDILKLKSEIEKFQAFAESEADEETEPTIGEAGQIHSISHKEKSWKQELQDTKTSVPLSIGLALTAGLVYDGIKNRGDDGDIIFTEPWKTMAVFTGAALLGWGGGRITRGDSAVKDAETLKIMMAEKEREIEGEKEEIEVEKEKKRETYRMLMSEPSSIEMLPSLNSMNVFGEYGSAVGQQGITYGNF